MRYKVGNSFQLGVGLENDTDYKKRAKRDEIKGSFTQRKSL